MAYNENPSTKGKTMKRKKRYGLLNFVLDVIMFSLTAGLWTIWIVIRELQMFNRR